MLWLERAERYNHSEAVKSQRSIFEPLCHLRCPENKGGARNKSTASTFQFFKHYNFTK
jgi:hypothetical protein